MYRVDFKRGDRVEMPRRGGLASGVIVSFPQQYLGVRFDGEKRTSRVHPTSVTRETTCRSEWTGPPPTVASGGWGDPGPSRHMHRVPGVWDSDNGDAAGKVCRGCWYAGARVDLATVRASVPVAP
jgi:hypothetical protein